MTNPQTQCELRDKVYPEGLQPRKKIVAVYAVVVAAWGLCGWVVYTGALMWVPDVVGLVVVMPFLGTMWPAGELMLKFESIRAGRTVLYLSGIDTAPVFVAWAAILWLPFLTLFWRKVPIRAGLLAQAGMMAAFFVAFSVYLLAQR